MVEQRPNVVGGSDAGKLIFTPMGAIAGVMIGAALPTGGWAIVYEIR
jgi:hypothetical protein